MKKTYILSLILFITMCFFAITMTGCFACFFDIPSLIMVVCCSFFLLLANYSPRDIGRYFSLGFKTEAVDAAELKQGITFFKATQKYLIISGGIGVFVGMIGMLATLDDPDMIGKGFALALITSLYAVFFSAIITIPFRTGLEKKLIEAETKA